MKASGVWFSAKNNNINSINYREKVENLKNVLNSWQLRRLTLLGKIAVIKSLAASQMVYVLSSLSTCQDTLREVNNLLYDFLWGGKGDKIKRTVMVSDYENGGLKMLDIFTFNKSLKVSWLHKFFDKSNKGKWKLILEENLEKLGGKRMLSGFISKEDAGRLEIPNNFYKEIIEIWTELSYQNSTHVNHLSDIKLHPIWNNSGIRINNQPVFYKTWSEKGVNYIEDILYYVNSDYRFMPLDSFTEKYAIQTDFVTFSGIISAIRSYYKNCKTHKELEQDSGTFLEDFCNSKKASKFSYLKLIKARQSPPTGSQRKWDQELNFQNRTEIDWKFVYSYPFKVTKETKLLNFQFKFIHRRIATNSFLFKIGKSNTEKCTLCNAETESHIHLFWECYYTQSFWNELKNWLNRELAKT